LAYPICLTAASATVTCTAVYCIEGLLWSHDSFAEPHTLIIAFLMLVDCENTYWQMTGVTSESLHLTLHFVHQSNNNRGWQWRQIAGGRTRLAATVGNWQACGSNLATHILRRSPVCSQCSQAVLLIGTVLGRLYLTAYLLAASQRRPFPVTSWSAVLRLFSHCQSLQPVGMSQTPVLIYE